MQEKEIPLLLAFTITCEGDNPEFPLHWDGIEVSAPASSLRAPKVQPKVPIPHQNKKFFPNQNKSLFLCKGSVSGYTPKPDLGAE